MKASVLALVMVFAFGCKGEDAEARAPSVAQMAALELPKGFRIDIFADNLPNARSMTLSPSGTLFVGSRNAKKVYAIKDAAGIAARNEKASAIVVASNLDTPNGVAFANGALYVAEVARILRFDDIENNLDKSPTYIVVRDDYPKDKHHGWKYIAIGPDGWLYVPVGAPCNLCLSDDPIYASLTRMTLDGKTREIYAHGIRNTVGFAWHPTTKALWLTENGSDNLGDDFPGDELDVAPTPGLHFGYPQCHNGARNDTLYGKDADCSERGPYKYPAQILAPHTAALGMKFYQGSMFPAEYRGRIFIAEHGSWNRSDKIGYRVTTVTVDGERGVSYEPFATGWQKGDGDAWGRPVDVLELPDGSLLVSDDQKGCIYRISYR